MPYAWTETSPPKTLTLWPHNSLPARGFVGFIAITSILFLLPLMAVLGSVILWGLLPFLLMTLAAAWWAIERNRKDRQITEILTFHPTQLTLTRIDKTGQRDWAANPYWVRVACQTKGGPVENYLTLEGGPRRVEIGAFLTPEERLDLQRELQKALSEP